MSDDSMLADLASQQAQTARDLRELAGDVAEFGGELRTVGERVGKTERVLGGLVADMERIAGHLGVTDEDEDEDADAAAPVAWHTLDREAARAEWDKLLTWVDEVLAPTYEITREQLPDCWPRHPAMRNELSWLRTCHLQSYLSAAHGGGAAEWHLRYLPGALDRIRQHAHRHGHLDEQEHGCAEGVCRLGAGAAWPQTRVKWEVTSRTAWHLDAVEADLAARPEPTPAATVDDN